MAEMASVSFISVAAVPWLCPAHSRGSLNPYCCYSLTASSLRAMDGAAYSIIVSQHWEWGLALRSHSVNIEWAQEGKKVSKQILWSSVLQWKEHWLWCWDMAPRLAVWPWEIHFSVDPHISPCQIRPFSLQAWPLSLCEHEVYQVLKARTWATHKGFVGALQWEKVRSKTLQFHCVWFCFLDFLFFSLYCKRVVFLSAR